MMEMAQQAALCLLTVILHMLRQQQSQCLQTVQRLRKQDKHLADGTHKPTVAALTTMRQVRILLTYHLMLRYMRSGVAM
jgi:hypothetical protein